MSDGELRGPRNVLPRLVGLPYDGRGFLVPAEAGWDENGPHVKGLGQATTFALAYHRACAVCGFVLEPGEPVYRIFNQGEAADRRLARGRNYELANPGHLVCMLYSSLVCPWWSTPGARLGKDSQHAPGARRGSVAAILGHDEYELLIPLGQPVVSAAFLYGSIIDDIRFRSPDDLAERYESAFLNDSIPSGHRYYWTNASDDQKDLIRTCKQGVKAVMRSQATRDVNHPDGTPYRSIRLPLL